MAILERMRGICPLYTLGYLQFNDQQFSILFKFYMHCILSCEPIKYFTMKNLLVYALHMHKTQRGQKLSRVTKLNLKF